MPRCCQSLEGTGSSFCALSNPPPGILSHDLSAAAVAAASARTAALLGAGPEQTAAAVQDAVHSFFRSLRKQEPPSNRTLYFDLYRDDEEEDHDDEVTCEPADCSAASDGTTPPGLSQSSGNDSSAASDRLKERARHWLESSEFAKSPSWVDRQMALVGGTTPAGMSQPSGNVSCGGSLAGREGMLRTPLAFKTSSHLSLHSGGRATQHTPQASAAGKQFRSPAYEEHETPAKSTAGMHWDAQSLLSGFGRSSPAPAWATSSSDFHVDNPPPALLQGAPLGLPPRPRSLPTPQRYGKLPRVRGVRASQLLDGALTSAFEM